jgi:uncharacterized membrane protein YfcA
MMTDYLLLISAGLAVGLTIGMTGVGSGSLMTPILVLLAGQAPGVAVGTDLLFAAITKLVATASFSYSRRVDWGIVWRLTAGSLPGSGTTLIWLWSSRHRARLPDALILHYLALILAFGAAVLLLQEPLRRLGLRMTAGWLKRDERYTQWLTIAAGFVLGVTVTLTSVGAGALGVVILLCLYPLRLASDRLVATDIAQALPVTLLAAIGHSALGQVNLKVLGCLLVGSIPGVLVASRAAIRLPESLVRPLIGFTLAVVSERMLFAG